jgi:ElaB/YqjD/DUF883 family membrane-anchored ribosome-binding protein
VSFKKICSFSLKREIYYALKDFLKEHETYRSMSHVVEMALEIFLKNPPKTNEEMIKELLKEVEELRKENEKLKQSHAFDPDYMRELLEAKRETEELKKEIDELKTKIGKAEEKYEPKIFKKDQDQNKKSDAASDKNLPSFLKDNPWVSILKERVKDMKKGE